MRNSCLQSLESVVFHVRVGRIAFSVFAFLSLHVTPRLEWSNFPAHLLRTIHGFTDLFHAILEWISDLNDRSLRANECQELSLVDSAGLGHDPRNGP